MENKEIVNLSQEQLSKKAYELKKSLFELRMKNTMGQLNNPIEIREARKSIARVLTALTKHKSVAPKTASAPKVKKTVKTTKSKTKKAK